MSRIFVSYSRESQDIVKTMVKDIEDLGHNPWFDQELTGGQAWWDQILDRIRKCNIFVYALTPEALESHACKLELDYAYKLKKTILPILVADGVSTSLLPTALYEIQFVDYRHKDKQAVIAVNKAINNLPAPQPLPDPLPKSPEVPISYLGELKEQIETTEALTFQEQSTMVLRLEEGLKEKDNSNDVRHLLERLRKREDLFAKVASKIDDILSSVTKLSAEPDPSRIKTNIIHLSTERLEHTMQRNLWLVMVVIFLLGGFGGLGGGLSPYIHEVFSSVGAFWVMIAIWCGTIALMYFVWRWVK